MSEDPYSQEVTRAGWLIDVGQYERAMQILAQLTHRETVKYLMQHMVRDDFLTFKGA